MNFKVGYGTFVVFVQLANANFGSFMDGYANPVVIKIFLDFGSAMLETSLETIYPKSLVLKLPLIIILTIS